MSTNIQNGYMFKTNDLCEINTSIIAFRKKLEPLQQAKTAKWLGLLAVGLIDTNTCFPKEVEALLKGEKRKFSTEPFMYAQQAWLEMKDECKKSLDRNPITDYGFDITIYPFENRLYAQIFTMQRDWMRIWNRTGITSNFSFWDNADRDTSVTVAEWKERKRIWENISAMHSSGTPSMIGFNAECTQGNMWVGIKDILKALPDFESRVEEWSARTLKQEYKKLEPSLDISFKDWLLTSQGVQQREACRVKVRSGLKEKITAEDLTEDIMHSQSLSSLPTF